MVVELLPERTPPLVELVLPPNTPPVEPAATLEVVVEPMLSVVVTTPPATPPAREEAALAAVRTVATVAPVVSVWTTVAVAPLPLLTAARAPGRERQTGVDAKDKDILTLAEAVADSVDFACVSDTSGGAQCSRAVTNTVAEVHVCAQAGDVVCSASQ